MAGRATLVQTVCSSMPLYHMQHNMLPKSVISQIEKLERAFLWGSSPEKKRCHQIGWNKICSPKAFGGLGILSLREMNLAFFYKLAWQLLTKEDNLWVRFIKGKYGVASNGVFEVSSKPTDSSFWRDIIRILPEFKDQIAWEVGDGNKIGFWDDKWISKDMILREYVVTDDHNINSSEKLSDFVNDQNQWDIGKLSNMLYKPAIYKILSFVPPDKQAGMDVPLWNLGDDSGFTTKSAYLSIKKLEANCSPSVWSSIWKGNNQQSHKLLLWRMCHNSLPTRSKTASWSGSSATCPSFFWDWRNRVVNEPGFVYPNEPHRVILSSAKNQLAAWKVVEASSVINCSWVQGFSLKIGLSNPLFAEIWSIAEGLSLAWNLGYRKVILENDSQVAVNCFRSGFNVDKVCHPAVKKVWDLLSKDWVVKIKHIPHIANKCVLTFLLKEV
ncbi:putative ribonuclease H protein At1g65750 family [Senna tora]|uniref:Putative ribonuclease H protein At1g65750 family n=1 Tax=Senna tora TaxID=362788 RepID=A0A834TGA1_9FABA|nr:putative ribonuclease H protein At1g65750 family [Senna tora]